MHCLSESTTARFAEGTLPESLELGVRRHIADCADCRTLVAETVGFSDHVQHARGVPHSDKMKIVERFRLTDPDTMTIETTVSDPEVLTAPYTTTASLRRHRNWTISEYICVENNRNYVDQSGKAGINLTLPGAPK